MERNGITTLQSGEVVYVRDDEVQQAREENEKQKSGYTCMRWQRSMT